jgi:sugar O-acyltransferase (sialic acid O-acetyltransferase NeuD family)
MGAGGHASVLADIVLMQKREIVAIFSPEKVVSNHILLGFPTYAHDKHLEEFDNNEFSLVNAVGKLPFSRQRENLANSVYTRNFCFEKIISESAYVSSNASLGEGVQVMPGAIIQSGAVIGDHSIINSNAVIEHDCLVGEFNHIAPSATVCGDVETGYDVYVGAGSTIKQGVHIGKNSIVGACTFINKDVSDGIVIKANDNQRGEGRR